MRAARNTTILLVVLLAASAVVRAQTSTGEVNGTATDNSDVTLGNLGVIHSIASTPRIAFGAKSVSSRNARLTFPLVLLCGITA